MTRSTLLCLATILLFSTAVTAQNNTDTAGLSCVTSNKECNSNGVCQSDGTCRCFVGFYPISTALQGYDCSFATPGPVANSTRIFCGAAFGFLLILITYRLILELIFTSTEAGAAKWTSRWNMALIVVFCIWMMIQSADYAGLYGVLSPKAWWAIYCFRDNLQLFIFSALLFHWADLYYNSIRKIRMANMIQKLKPDYEANITMDSILLELNFMNKFRMAYVAICVTTLFVYIGQNILYSYSRDQSSYRGFVLFYQIFYLCVWVVFEVGYIYYGLKLLKILPSNVTGKVISVMVLMALFAIFASASSALNLQILVNYNNSVTNSRQQLLCAYALSWFVGFWAVNIFMPIWQWHRWMNPVLIKSMWSESTRGTNSTSQPSKDADLEMNVSTALSTSNGLATSTVLSTSVTSTTSTP